MLRQISPISFQILLRCPAVHHCMGSHRGGGMTKWTNKELSSQTANRKEKITKLERQVKKLRLWNFGIFWKEFIIQAKKKSCYPKKGYLLLFNFKNIVNEYLNDISILSLFILNDCHINYSKFFMNHLFKNFFPNLLMRLLKLGKRLII